MMRWIGLWMMLAGCGAIRPGWEVRGRMQPVRGGSDSAMAVLLRPCLSEWDSLQRLPLARTAVPLTKAQPECTLGNIVADAFLESADADAAFLSYAGLGTDYLPPGGITRDQAAGLLPRDGRLVVAECSAETVQALCDWMAQRRGWPVSGIRYRIRAGKAEEVRVRGAPLRAGGLYRIATVSYAVAGTPLRECAVKRAGVFARDAVNRYLERCGQRADWRPMLEQRVIYAE